MYYLPVFEALLIKAAVLLTKCLSAPLAFCSDPNATFLHLGSSNVALEKCGVMDCFSMLSKRLLMFSTNLFFMNIPSCVFGSFVINELCKPINN